MSNTCSLQGMGQLDVWISKLGNPCQKSDRTWYVTIFHCDGPVVKWCNQEYIVMPAKCGRLSVNLPPGCYYVSAVWGYTQTGTTYHGNHFTDGALVEICCNQCKCITLFNPEVHRCGQILLKAAQDVANQPGAFDQVQFDALAAAMQPLLDAAPLTGPELDLDPRIDQLAALREQVVATGLGDAINPVETQRPLAENVVPDHINPSGQ